MVPAQNTLDHHIYIMVNFIARGLNLNFIFKYVGYIYDPVLWNDDGCPSAQCEYGEAAGHVVRWLDELGKVVKGSQMHLIQLKIAVIMRNHVGGI